MNLKLLAAAAAAALAGTPASAAIMQATYTGSIYGGVDVQGVFGAPGTDLTGQTFEYDFVYDTQAGNLVANLGGQALRPSGSSQPVLAASVTILGHTVSPSGLNGFYTDAASTVPDFGVPAYGYKGAFCNYAGAVSGSWFAVCLATNDDLPADLETPFTATGATPFPGTADGAFPSPATPPFDQFLLYGLSSTLTVTKLADSVDTGAVPEPAAWTLMILGFGAAGAMLRRRRAAARPAAL